jgi:predicted ArsR family transcriptional regulator
MLLPVFRDLVKPQWRTVLETLKREGGMAVADLARGSGMSYMAVKAHCEGLQKAGYLIRTRTAHGAVGRPEIFYSLADKADDLFPGAGTGFSLALLDSVRRMFGDTAPEKLLFQYFQGQFEGYAAKLDKVDGFAAKLARLAKLRCAAGHAASVTDDPPCLIEYHNPLQRVFDAYPRAAAMELNMIRQLLGRQAVRRELPVAREGMPRVVFEIS